MASYAELMKIMKQASLDAERASCPVQICFGKVTSESPLKILVDQKMTLGKTQLVLTRGVTDYETEITVNGSIKQTYKHYDALKVGEEVVLLRQQGGQKYIVVDRVVTS